MSDLSLNRIVGLIENRVTSLTNTFIEKTYPIGHILMTENPANPSTYLGVGTWVAYGAGKVPVGIDTAQTEFNELGKTGGEKAHKLTVNEMPSHNHPFEGVLTSALQGASGSGVRVNTTTKQTSNTGGDQSHNNLQPYIVCYMWKRTV